MKIGNKYDFVTKTGDDFEKKSSILNVFKKADYNIKEESKLSWDIQNIGKLFIKTGLYDWFIEKNINWKEFWSKRLIPDTLIINDDKKTAFIIEIKYQQVSGSVDEKLQTCEFKLKQYQKIFNFIGYKTEFIYLLNDWFKDKSYNDVLNYISEKKCHYFFNEINIDFFK